MRKSSVCLGAGILLLLTSGFANADTFTLSSITVDLHDNEPGLVVGATDFLDVPFSFDLDSVGDFIQATLFTIGTTETTYEADDGVPYPITIALGFEAPPPAFGGETSGMTGAFIVSGTPSGRMAGFNSPLPVILNFGTTGQLRVQILPAMFTLPGSAAVVARFTLLSEDIGESVSVPEPASSLLFMLGAGAVAAFGRKRKRRAFLA
jgi:PEP-CTERM motif